MGNEFFLELKNISAPDYGARQIDYDSATKGWKWNKTDAMTQLFDQIGLLQKAKSFVPRKFVKADHELTEDDKKFDRMSFANFSRRLFFTCAPRPTARQEFSITAFAS